MGRIVEEYLVTKETILAGCQGNLTLDDYGMENINHGAHV